MKYRVTNVPHVVPVERTWNDKKVVHSLPPNVPKLIGHAVHVLLDNSQKICLSLNVCGRGRVIPEFPCIPLTLPARAAALYLWYADLDTP